MVRTLLLAICVLACTAQALLAGPLQDDVKARRARVMERLTPQTMAIVWSAPERVYSADVNYEYRQDSNMLYLTAIDQPGTILVLMPGNKTQREVLFISEPNPRREHREGHLLTKEEATAGRQSWLRFATLVWCAEFATRQAALAQRSAYLTTVARTGIR